MKKLYLLLLISTLLLSSCTKKTNSIDKESIDQKLEEGKIKDSNSGLVSDITQNIELPSQQVGNQKNTENTENNIRIRDEELELNKEKEPSQPTPQPTPEKPLTTVDKLIIQDILVGTGKEATDGAKVTVHYNGTLTNGIKFDSSIDKETPFSFTLGAGQVIKGWEQGILGMKEGGKRMLTIPASLAYGNQAIGNIPAGATLVFEVELLKVEN